jgi:hypothetical protein
VSINDVVAGFSERKRLTLANMIASYPKRPSETPSSAKKNSLKIFPNLLLFLPCLIRIENPFQKLRCAKNFFPLTEYAAHSTDCVAVNLNSVTYFLAIAT